VQIFSPNGGTCEADAMSDPRDASGYSATDLISMGFLSALSGFACSSSAPASAPTPAMTSAAESRNVTFQSGDLTLVGTLTLPERTAGASVPALVLIAGSGPFDRNEVMSGQLAMSFGFGMYGLRAADIRSVPEARSATRTRAAPRSHCGAIVLPE
jgi:hypothetical protein